MKSQRLLGRWTFEIEDSGVDHLAVLPGEADAEFVVVETV